MKVKAAALLLFVSATAHAHLPGISRSVWTRSCRDVEARFVFNRADAPARLGPLVTGCEVTGEERKDVEADGVEQVLTLRCENCLPVRVSLAALLRPLGKSHRHFAKHDDVDDALHTEAAELTLALSRSETPWSYLGLAFVALGTMLWVLQRLRQRGPQPPSLHPPTHS